MRIAIIGAGNMGGALALGLAFSGKVEAKHICVSNPSKRKLDNLKGKFHDIEVTTDNLEAVKKATIIVLAVKPWIVPAVIAEIKGALDYEKQIIVSMAAGITHADLDMMLMKPEEKTPLPPCYRMIPNTAIAICQSMTFVTAMRTSIVLDEQMMALLDAVGTTMKVDERALDAGMAVASCGIAFAMRYIRAAMEGGVQLGLRPAEALKAVLQTVRGAAQLLQDTDAHPEVEIDKVTTAGGFTIRGLNAMEQNGFTGSVIAGLTSCK